MASGLAAGRIEENLPRDSLGPQTIALIRRLFQTALGRPRGMLHIESTPSESIVRIDDRVLGKTPLDRVSLAGKHRLHVEQRGFVPFDSDITLEPGQTAQIAATLTAKEQPLPHRHLSLSPSQVNRAARASLAMCLGRCIGTWRCARRARWLGAFAKRPVR